MDRVRSLAGGIAWWSSAVLLCLVPPSAALSETQRVSVSATGAQASGSSYQASLSADGSRVAFTSEAKNLVAGDSRDYQDVFVRDLTTNTLWRISQTAGGVVGNSDSLFPTISGDGRYVAFVSYASNLVTGDTNSKVDVFLRDLSTGTTQRVSVNVAGEQGNGHCAAYAPALSSDGRYVAFESGATNLVPGDTNGVPDIFVKDTQTGAVTRASVGPSGEQADGRSYEPSLSSDGRYLVFTSDATNLVADDGNGKADVFLKDLETGAVSRLSLSTSGEEGNGRSGAPKLAADGHTVAFTSQATNLVEEDTNDTKDVFVRDLDTGTIARVSVSAQGQEANAQSDGASISADGRFVAFWSDASNLADEGAPVVEDVFIKDRTTGEVRCVSNPASGLTPDGSSREPSLSGDGLAVAFTSSSTNLVAGDTNGSNDVFVTATGFTLPPPVSAALSTVTVSPTEGVVADGTATATITVVVVDTSGDPLPGREVVLAASGSGNTLTQPSATDENGTATGTLASTVAETKTLTVTVDPDDGPVVLDSQPTVTFVADEVPTAQDQTVGATEDTPHTITLTGTDPEGKPLSFALVTSPGHGSLVGTPPSLTYQPEANYHGSDSFSFTVNDGRSSSAPATVSITVASVNDPPVALGQSVEVPEDTPLTITLGGTDVDGDSLTFSVLSQPQHGVLSGQAPNLVYTPDANYHGPDSFTFRASDGQLSSETATVSLTVASGNDVPVAGEDLASTLEDEPVDIAVLANDTDADGDALMVTQVTQGAHGAVSLVAGGTVRYTPAAGYFGTDSFTYTISDARGGSASGDVTVTIQENTAPQALPQSVTVEEDSFVAVTLTATDVEGDALSFAVTQQPTSGSLTGTPPHLTYAPMGNYHGADSFRFTASDGHSVSSPVTVSITVSPVDDPILAFDQQVVTAEDASIAVTLSAESVDDDPLTYEVVDPPAHGTLTGTAPSVTYKPAAEYEGTDSFTFRATDGRTQSNTATVTVTVVGVNDRPVAEAQSLVTPEDTPLAITLSGHDAEGDALTFTVLQPPEQGALTGSAPNLTYTPRADYHGPDRFTFRVFDGELTSFEAEVTLQVASANDVPGAADQQITTAEDQAVSFILAISDADGDPLTLTITTAPAHGALSGTLPHLTYNPHANYHGTDQLVYRVSDGTEESTPATVSFVVTPVNDAPIALNDEARVLQDASVDVDVLANDSDAEGGSLAIVATTTPAHGSVVVQSSGVVRYTPQPGYAGTDRFEYTTADPEGARASAYVDVMVIRNAAPVAEPQAATTPEDTPVGLTLQASDAEGDPLTYSVVDAPGHGNLSGTLPDVTYTPAPNYHGPESFTFRVSDGHSTSPPALVSITVTPVNDAPTVQNAAATTAEDTPVAVDLAAADVEGDALTYEVVTPPAHGLLSGSAPHLTYTPEANYNGPDRFTFRASDPESTSETATASLSVSPVNDAPTVQGAVAATPEDTALPLRLEASDVDGDLLSYILVRQPDHGTLSGTAPDLTYTPHADYFGPDSFSFRVSDGLASSAVAQVSLTVSPVEDPLVALNQEVTLAEDGTVGITLTAIDVDGGAVTFTLLDAPSHGTLSGSAPDLVYTPQANYHGPDALTFRAHRGAADSNLGTVSLVVTPVNDPPVAAGQSAQVLGGLPLNLTLSATDADGDSITFTIMAPPAHGSLGPLTGGQVTYTAEEGYAGPDAFIFEARDPSGGTGVATVSLTVTEGTPVAALESTHAEPGQTVPVALSLTEAGAGALDLEVTLRCLAAGAPPLQPGALSLAPGAEGWTLSLDPANPWRCTASRPAGALGAGPVLRLLVTLPAEALRGTVYALEAESFRLTREGAEPVTDVRLVLPGCLLVPELRKGDISGDGGVTVDDVLDILRYYVLGVSPPTDWAPWAADANCDGRVSLADAIVVLRHCLLGVPLACQ